MTRINTNVSSLVAQKTLARSNSDLQTALNRLSTGLRINTGKDDPAGLIASEVLGSDIVSVQKAVTNSERANQIIATADSALGQVSSLLNDIRGLVSEAANTGALSDQQIAANQLQIDSSLQAIDRIAQTTSFQGRRLLDGSLDFLTTSSGTADIAALGTFGTSTDAFASLAITGGGGANSNVTFTAVTAGAASNGYAIRYSTGAALGSESASVDTVGKTIEFKVNDATTANGIVGVVNNDLNVNTLFSATASGTGNAAVGSVAATSTANGVNGNTVILTAATGGPSFNNLKVILATGAATGAESATYTTAGNTLTITKHDNSTAAQIKAAIDAEGTFTSALTGNGLGTYAAGTTLNVTTGGSLGSSNISDLRIDQANFGTASAINATVIVDTQATQGSLVYSGGTLSADLNLEVGGDKGFNVFNFGTGTTIAQIASALNLVSDATGVSASVNGSDLTLKSTDYGSDGFVSARA
jgi:flagellin